MRKCVTSPRMTIRLFRDRVSTRGIAKKLSNYPKTGCNPRKIRNLRAFSDSYLASVGLPFGLSSVSGLWRTLSVGH
jgi:hypothetical protein